MGGVLLAGSDGGARAGDRHEEEVRAETEEGAARAGAVHEREDVDGQAEGAGTAEPRGSLTPSHEFHNSVAREPEASDRRLIRVLAVIVRLNDGTMVLKVINDLRSHAVELEREVRMPAEYMSNLSRHPFVGRGHVGSLAWMRARHKGNL